MICVIIYIFVAMNISPAFEQLSRFLALIGQPARIRILMVLGPQEACVCHLEAALGLRQASISQHLMALRKGGLVASRRSGRHIFYYLAQPQVTAALEQAARLAGCDPAALQALAVRPVPGCTCPHCCPGVDPLLVCRKPDPNPHA
jgi:DNA-binding transcriptional ArsR family regulator